MEPETSAIIVNAAPIGALDIVSTSMMRIRHTSAINPMTAIIP